MNCIDCGEELKPSPVCHKCWRERVAQAARAGLLEGLNASDNIYEPLLKAILSPGPNEFDSIYALLTTAKRWNCKLDWSVYRAVGASAPDIIRLLTWDICVDLLSYCGVDDENILNDILDYSEFLPKNGKPRTPFPAEFDELLVGEGPSEGAISVLDHWKSDMEHDGVKFTDETISHL